jgi:outer membrane protein assembly factor BamE
LALSGCGLVHKIDIQQGNLIEPEAVSKLELGMSTQKVRYLLGTPLIMDVFHRQRWDYVYSLQVGGEKREQQRLTLFFENDALVKADGDIPVQLKAPTAPTAPKLPVL